MWIGNVREAVTKSMGELGELFDAPVAVTTYIEGLDDAAGRAAENREALVRVLRAAADERAVSHVTERIVGSWSWLHEASS